MVTFGYELEEEFNAVTQFINDKYGIIIKSKEQLVYFQEMLSNAVHIILLGNIDMKIPALIMLRRTQELILTFIFYSEHPVELFKKEMDDNSRTVSGFNELKDYIKNYPYSMKYILQSEYRTTYSILHPLYSHNSVPFHHHSHGQERSVSSL